MSEATRPTCPKCGKFARLSERWQGNIVIWASDATTYEDCTENHGDPAYVWANCEECDKGWMVEDVNQVDPNWFTKDEGHEDTRRTETAD